MRHGRRAISAMILGALITAPAAAATLWNEATDGDLSGQFFNASELDFALGINRVVGSSYFLSTSEGYGDWDNDYFLFRLPERGTLQAITISFRVTESPAGAMFLQPGYEILQWEPVVGPYPALSIPVWMINQPDPSAVVNPLRLRGLELTSPRYLWWDRGILSNYGNRWDYEFEFLVTRAPEPGTLALLGLGLLGLGVSRRRKA